MKHAPIPIPGRAPEDGVKAIFMKTGEQPFTLSNYKGRYVVLLFYTGDWECKENIVAFENLLDKYAGAGCEVFGCSSDSTKVHQSWIRTPSEDGGFGGSLRIPLISDPSGGMSQKFDVYDSEEGTCRNAVVIIDDSGIVRHAMTTSLEHEETARNCLDIVAMLKQSKLSDSEVRNINARAESSKKKKTAKASSGGASFREMSPVHMDKGELEKCWDISTDPELNKVLNLAKMLGKTAPPPAVQKTREPCFDISTDQIRRMLNPRTAVRSCRATLHRNLAGFTAQTLGKGQKTKIEGLVQRMMGVGQMSEDLTEGQGAGAGAYVPVYPRSSSSYGPQYASYLSDTTSFSYANSTSSYQRTSSETRYGAGLEAAYRSRARSTSRSAQMDYRGAASTRMSTEYKPTTDSYSEHCRAAAQRRSRSMSRPVSSYGSYSNGPSSSLVQAQTYASTNPRATYIIHGRSRSNSSHRDY